MNALVLIRCAAQQPLPDIRNRLGAPRKCHPAFTVMSFSLQSPIIISEPVRGYRLKGSTDDLASACEMLNRDGETRFAQLSGVFPLHSPVQPDRDFVRRIYDFSSFPGSGGAVPHAEVSVLLFR